MKTLRQHPRPVAATEISTGSAAERLLVEFPASPCYGSTPARNRGEGTWYRQVLAVQASRTSQCLEEGKGREGKGREGKGQPRSLSGCGIAPGGSPWPRCPARRASVVDVHQYAGDDCAGFVA